MNPQTPIEQVPDETLATFGWNLRENQDAHRKQAEALEAQVQAVRQEFQRRGQIRQQATAVEEDKKRTEQDVIVDKLMAKLAERNGHVFSPPQDSKVPGEGSE